MKIDNREQWIITGANILIDELITPVISIKQPPMNYSLTAPKAGQSTSKILGECWHKKASAAGIYEIFLTASLGNADSVLILSTLIHEILHAYNWEQGGKGHEKEFIALCKLVGLEGGETKKAKHSFTATVPSQELIVILEDIVNDLGNIPHDAVNPSQSGKKKQTNRQKLVLCTQMGCGFKFRASQKVINSMITMRCNGCGYDSLVQEAI